MKKMTEKEFRRYALLRLKEEELTDLCKEIIFRRDFYGYMCANQYCRYLVVNLESFYKTLLEKGLNVNVANLIILTTFEHELAHLKQFKASFFGKPIEDEQTYLIKRSIDFERSLPLEKSNRKTFYFSFYHEYCADIEALKYTLSSNEFLSRAKSNGVEDLYTYNKEMASRILSRYRFYDGSNQCPLSLFLLKAYYEQGYLTQEDVEIISSLINSSDTIEDAVILGTVLSDETIEELENINSGKNKTKNVLSLISKLK